MDRATLQISVSVDQQQAAAREWLKKGWDGQSGDLLDRVFEIMQSQDSSVTAGRLRTLFAELSDNEVHNVGNLLQLVLSETFQRMRTAILEETGSQDGNVDDDESSGN